MEKHINSEELIVAVLQGEDYSEAIEELNGKGFYVTILNSTGCFFKKEKCYADNWSKKSKTWTRQ